jgi:Icc-related predicted phosphoesterase
MCDFICYLGTGFKSFGVFENNQLLKGHHMTAVSVCCISDTHGYLPNTLPECDILIHAGDITHSNVLQEQASFLNTKFLEWWREQKADLKYFIAGNHDKVFQEFPQLINNETKIDYLQDEPNPMDSMGEVDFMMPNVWGSPWTPKYGDWAFMGDDKFLEHKYAQIPKGTDILITHGPPYGIMDINDVGRHCGSKALRDAVERVKPKLHVFGHIHEGRENYSKLTVDGTQYVNASIMNERYRPNNPAVLVEIYL